MEYKKINQFFLNFPGNKVFIFVEPYIMKSMNFLNHYF